MPMGREELLPYEQRAPNHVISRYQNKVGSLLYAAVTARADIAFAVSRLSSFMTNLALEHPQPVLSTILGSFKYCNVLQYYINPGS